MAPAPIARPNSGTLRTRHARHPRVTPSQMPSSATENTRRQTAIATGCALDRRMSGAAKEMPRIARASTRTVPRGRDFSPAVGALSGSLVSEDRVDERRQRRSLREHQQRADEEQDHENREHPEFLANPHERPELAKNPA